MYTGCNQIIQQRQFCKNILHFVLVTHMYVSAQTEKLILKLDSGLLF